MGAMEPRPASGNGLFRLLLVEDNPGDADLTCERLASMPGHAVEVSVVTRLSDAIDELERSWIDAVILDLNLPDSSGIETLIKLRRVREEVAIIVLSGESGEDLRHAAMREGAQDFLSKNESASRLVARSFLYVLERHRMEVQHRQVQQIIASNPDALIVTDSDGIVQFANDTALSLFGKPRDAFVGEALGLPIREGQVFEIEFGRGGETCVAEVRAVPFLWNRQQAFLASIRDITEKKRMGDQLRQAQKMEAVGLLAGGVAHDFNNLLTVILNCAEFVREEFDETDRGYKDVKQILRAAERGVSLVNQLLAFARKQPSQPQIVDLNEKVEDSRKMLDRMLPSNVEIVMTLESDVWPVLIDPGQVEQLVINLAINAKDAMPDGGCIAVEVKKRTLAAATGALPQGDYVMLRVADSGYGIAPEHFAKIFDPFFTTKDPGKGTGLGLATCMTIVREAGGDITVESKLGRGTTFTILLPRAKGEQVAGRAGAPNGPASLDGDETILVVEDDPAVRQMTCELLERHGYRVIAATDGEQACAILADAGDTVALVLSDVMMPQMGGRDLARRLKRTHPDLGIVFMTGYADNGTILQELVSQNRTIVFKPFRPKDLLRAIRTQLAATGRQDNPVKRAS